MCAARAVLGTGTAWLGQGAQPRSRAGDSSGEQKGKSLAASWEPAHCGISLPHPVMEPQLVEVVLPQDSQVSFKDFTSQPF